MKSLMYELCNLLLKHGYDVMVASDDNIYIEQTNKITEARIKKMYQEWDIGECSVMAIDKDYIIPVIRDKKVKGYQSKFEPHIDFDNLDTDKYSYVMWNEYSCSPETRIHDIEKELDKIINVSALQDKWAEFYKYL